MYKGRNGKVEAMERSRVPIQTKVAVQKSYKVQRFYKVGSEMNEPNRSFEAEIQIFSRDQ